MVIEVKKYNPKDVMLFISLPGSKLAEIFIELKNVPGALAEASDLLFRYGVNILTGMHIVGASEVGNWIFFADFTNAIEPPGVIIEKLRKLDKVVDAKYIESENFIMESFLYPVISWDRRCVIMDAKQLGLSLTKMKELLGSGGATLLFYQGFEYGSQLMKWIKKIIEHKVTLKELLSILFKTYRTSGWGVAELVEENEDEKLYVIRVYECFEALSKTTLKIKDNSCDFNRGFWSGALSEILGVKMRAIEERCVSKGDQYCQFKVKMWG